MPLCLFIIFVFLSTTIILSWNNVLESLNYSCLLEVARSEAKLWSHSILMKVKWVYWVKVSKAKMTNNSYCLPQAVKLEFLISLWSILNEKPNAWNRITWWFLFQETKKIGIRNLPMWCAQILNSLWNQNWTSYQPLWL